MGNYCARRQPLQVLDNGEAWEIIAPNHPIQDEIHQHQLVHDPEVIRERAVGAPRPRRRRVSRLLRCFKMVLKLKRLRWLQSMVRSSLHGAKLRGDPALRERYVSLLSYLTQQVTGTASWFDHLKRQDGTLYFVAHLSEKGNVNRATKRKEREYRRVHRGHFNHGAGVKRADNLPPTFKQK